MKNHSKIVKNSFKNCSFFPTGTKDPLVAKQEGEITRGDVLGGVLKSALKVDLEAKLG